MRQLIPVLALAALAGCGHAVYRHSIELTLEDPSGRLNGEPVELSVFDTYGYTEEFARQTAGTTAPGQPPYGAVVAGSAQKMIYDFTPGDVQANLALLSIEPRGYFNLHLQPVAGTEQTATLPYQSYLVATRDEAAIRPLTARYRSESSRKGWKIRLTVVVPPAPEAPAAPAKVKPPATSRP
jgi:hypothetical protein